MLETMKPMDIEKRSFEIITGLLEGRVLDPENELVIKRGGFPSPAARSMETTARVTPRSLASSATS